MRTSKVDANGIYYSRQAGAKTAKGATERMEEAISTISRRTGSRQSATTARPPEPARHYTLDELNSLESYEDLYDQQRRFLQPPSERGAARGGQQLLQRHKAPIDVTFGRSV